MSPEATVAPADEAVTETPTPAPASEADATCSTLDLATLEATDPENAPPSAAMISVRTIYPEATPSSEPPVSGRIDLGTIDVPGPMRGDPAYGGAYGMGWMVFGNAWVEDGLTDSLRGSLERWTAERKGWSDAIREEYLLGRRQRYLQSMPAPDGWPSPACLAQAVERARKTKTAHLAEATAMAEQLLAEIDALDKAGAKLSPEDRLLQASLLDESDDLEQRARGRSLFEAVAKDRSARSALRARAAERLARLATEPDDRRKALERALALGPNPELGLELRMKLLDMEPDEAVKAKKLDRVIDELLAGDQRFETAMRLGERAELRLESGDYAGARDDAIECLRRTPEDFPDDPDPWGCALPLAESLVRIGDAGPTTQIPRDALAPVAWRLIQACTDHYDLHAALHAGNLTLDHLPLAPQMPHIADALVHIESDPDARKALQAWADEKVRGEWDEAQRERLAWDLEPQQLQTRIDGYLDDVFKAPAIPNDLEESWRWRVDAAAGHCANELTPGARYTITATTVPGDGRPRVIVGGPPGRACLQRSLPTYARGVRPAKVRATLHVRD